MRYAAWLEPAPAEAARWQSLLDGLRARYDGAPFVPHVTLTSGLEGEAEAVIARFHRLARGRGSLPLALTATRSSSHRFQAVTVGVRPTPALLRLRRRIRSGWGLAAAPYDPHLSLLYAQLQPERQTTILADLADRRWPLVHARRLTLWRIAGDTEHWRRVAIEVLTG